MGWPAGSRFKWLFAHCLSQEPTVEGRLVPQYKDVYSQWGGGDQDRLEFAVET